MTGRVAIVTGAGRGIGAATVHQLADAGWSVLAVDRGTPDPDLPYELGSGTDLEAVVAEANRRASAAHAGAAGRSRTERGERAADRLSPAGHPVRAWFADVRDPNALVEAVAAAESEWGGVDAAFAVAGVIAGGVPLWDMPIEQERAVLDVCLGGVINLARAAVPALLRRPEPRSGRFLAVASAAATKGLPMLAVYCAAKAGVAGLVRSLGAELGGTGITANAVSPGSTDTALLTETARLYGLPTAKGFAMQQPIGRLLEPGEIASVLTFLAGAGADAVTGATVAVDGGLAL
ncbi:SDR family oxidoreductase [Nocardia jejuensis]|uniref:SDR family oxidoreductase n=1 Tax=Nocardia jejuensis TaxID=328049 RepID=UPI000834C58C|nr:SDR family oxidoreductase [Nocardia jejuensis]